VTFTADVRDELARVNVDRPCCRLAEAAALLRLGGALQRRGGKTGVGCVVSVTGGAVARRLRAALTDVLGTAPDVEVHEPTGFRRVTAYRIHIPAPADGTLQRLGLLDPAGQPAPGVPAGVVGAHCDEVAYVRGALMAAGSVSHPRQSPHLEIRTTGEVLAGDLARLVRKCASAGARPAPHGAGWRVVVKSAEGVMAVLARTGAHAACLRWDRERFHRELRGDAARVANADRANLARAAGAAARQTRAVEEALAAVDWDGLPDELREIALVRLANPDSSLAELGALCDPPVGKSTVHRRLGRLLSARTLSSNG
jgi:cell division protein WhiA